MSVSCINRRKNRVGRCEKENFNLIYIFSQKMCMFHVEWGLEGWKNGVGIFLSKNLLGFAYRKLTSSFEGLMHISL